MRRLLVLVSAIIFVDAVLFTALTPLVPDYAEQFDLSKAGAGVLVGAFGAGALFGGIPGGLAATRFGPRRAVVSGLLLLGLASFAFAASNSAATVVAARFLQGLSSTMTWAGALAWIALSAPKRERAWALGIVFAAAIVGAVTGPMFGAIAELVGVHASFVAVGVVAAAFAALSMIARSAPPEPITSAGVTRAFRDPRFLGGLWLNALPAFLFGMLVVLVPLDLDAAGWSTLAIASIFFAAGLLEAVANPILGRVTDRIGALLPVRVTLVASALAGIALASASRPEAIAFLTCVAALSFGCFYTPGMALTSHRADSAGLAQGLAFGIMNTAWALGALVGPTLAGALGGAYDDAVPYLVGAAACAVTLALTARVPSREVDTRAA